MFTSIYFTTILQNKIITSEVGREWPSKQRSKIEVSKSFAREEPCYSHLMRSIPKQKHFNSTWTIEHFKLTVLYDRTLSTFIRHLVHEWNQYLEQMFDNLQLNKKMTKFVNSTENIDHNVQMPKNEISKMCVRVCVCIINLSSQ